MRMIPEKETLTVEFKSDLKKLPDHDLIEAVVGMTNTKGGTLYLGVEDHGEITGVCRQHADEIGVAALVANKTVPSVAVRAELVTESGKDVLKIDIPMSRTIVAAADGKILRRRQKEANLEKLLKSGLVEVNGSFKTGAFMLSASVYKKQETGTRYIVTDRKGQEERILELARQQGYVMREDVRKLFQISNSQAYRVLKKMADQGKLELSGKGRNARYELTVRNCM